MNLESMAKALMEKRHALNVAAALGAAGWPNVEDADAGIIGRSGQYGIIVDRLALDTWTEMGEGAERPFQILDFNNEITIWTRRIVSPERAEELLGKYGVPFFVSERAVKTVPAYEEAYGV